MTSRLSAIIGRLWLPSTVLGMLLIVLIWSGVSALLYVERDKTVQGAINEGASLSRLAEENTTRLILGVDRTLMLLRQIYEDDPDHFDLRRWASRTNLVGDLAIHYATIAADGYMSASTADYQGRIFLADREHFKVHADGGADELFISKPVLGRASGKWSIQLTRRLRKPDGSFAGVILGSLDPAFILGFYETIDIGAKGTVTLRGADGVIRGAYGFSAPQIGEESFPAALRTGLEKRAAGQFWGVGEMDGVQRLISYRKLANLPLIVTIGLAEQTIFAGYEQHTKIYLSLASLLTLLVLAVVGVSVRHHGRMEHIRDHLRRSEARARAKSVELGLTLNNMSQGIMMVDADSKVPVLNQRAVALLGLPEQFSNAPVALSDIAAHADLGHDEDAALSADSQVSIAERTRRDGTALEVRRVPLAGGGMVFTYTDITDRKLAEREILHLAKHDTLTNLANRSLLKDCLDRAVADFATSGRTFAVLYLDLDRFKPINDTFGHPVGDILISKVADRLREHLPAVDIIARLGGDEFVIVQSGVGSAEEALPLAKQIIEDVSAPYEVNGNTLIIGTSIGVVLASQQCHGADDLLGRADLALYRAKAEGRNCIRFFEDEMANAAILRGTLELELRAALQRGEFELHYQPWVDLATQGIAGCETLVRWRHPTRGLILPGEFIKVLEDSGLIRSVGEWILRTACREATSWPDDVTLAVNLSPAQFSRANFEAFVFQTTEESGLPLHRLELEITESLLIDDQEKAMETLTSLRDRGVSIALDDFGTGYSSLTYLRQFPFDRIKIDKGFVADMTTRNDCAAIVAAVAGLGKALDMDITAEGIESHEQSMLLRAAGCTHGQGYFFACPMSAQDLAATFAEQAASEMQPLRRVPAQL